MRDLGEINFGDSTDASNGNLDALNIGSEAWFAAASNEQIIDLVYQQYAELAGRIDDIATGLREDERVHHMGIQIQNGNTRNFLAEDDVLGDFPMLVGRASRRFLREAQETGDFTQCLTLAFTLQDPVLADHLLSVINLKRVSPQAFASTGYTELDQLEDPGIKLWRHGRLAMAERRNRGVDEFQAALTSHARREAKFAIDSELRHELNEDDAGIVQSLSIAVYIKRLLQGSGNRQAKQVQKLIKERLKELSQSQTVPERLFVESLHAQPLIDAVEI